MKINEISPKNQKICNYQIPDMMSFKLEASSVTCTSDVSTTETYFEGEWVW